MQVKERRKDSHARELKPRRRRTTKPTGWRGHLIFLLPAGIYLGLFAVFPVGVLTQMAFSDVTTRTLTKQWPFVGLANFQALFSDPNFYSVLINTCIYVAIVVGLGLGAGFTMAVALQKNGAFAGATLAIMIFVWTLPPLVNGTIWKSLLSNEGLLNELLVEAHLPAAPIAFLQDNTLSLIAVAVVNGWAVVPFAALVFRAALMEVDPQLYEAAAVDGAGRRHLAYHVVFPAVKPTIAILFIILVVNAFRAFDFTYVMTSGGPGLASTTLPYLSYLDAFVRFDFGASAAVSLLTVVVLVALSALYASSVRRGER